MTEEEIEEIEEETETEIGEDRNIFQTWKNQKCLDDFQKKCIDSWRNNKEFKYYFFNDNNCTHFVLMHYPKYFSLYSALNCAEKSDVFRYLILHKYGGIYTDIDTECTKPIINLIKQYPNSIITGYEYYNPKQYLQWFIAAPKNSKFFIDLVEEILRRYNSYLYYYYYIQKTSNQMTYWLTGPEVFTDVLDKYTGSKKILDKGILGSYEDFKSNKPNKNAYLIHYFKGTWKNKKV